MRANPQFQPVHASPQAQPAYRRNQSSPPEYGGQFPGRNLLSVPINPEMTPDALPANAFARRGDIHLGPGQEMPLPHEAAHVVQQRGTKRPDPPIER